jgi:hypothetical protein
MYTLVYSINPLNCIGKPYVILINYLMVYNNLRILAASLKLVDDKTLAFCIL